MVPTIRCFGSLVILRVPYPKIEAVRRARPGVLSEGDYAITTTTTALIELLDGLAPAGYSFRHVLPTQLGGTSCDALLSRSGVAAGEAWTGYRLDIDWGELPKNGTQIETVAVTERATHNLACFLITASRGGVQCATGRAYYVRLRNNVNLATESRIHGPQDTPPSDKDAKTIDQVYSPDIVKLLMNPISGNTEPLGRRLHPLSSVSWAAAAYQGLKALPGKRLRQGSMRYVRNMPTDANFIAATSRQSDSAVSVELSSEAGILFAKCNLAA